MSTGNPWVKLLPITAPPRLWSHEQEVTDRFTWSERPNGWAISDGPFELLTHYSVGGSMTEDGPMILRGRIDGPRFAEDAARAAQYGQTFEAVVPNQYRRHDVSDWP